MKKLIFILLFVPALLKGATLYVDESGIDNAGRNGSISQPFASFHYAVTRAVTGDIIYFNAGEYYESVQIELPVQISLDGAGRDLVTIYITANYRPFLLMESAVEGTNGNQSIKNITIDGTNTCDALIHIHARSNILIENCRFINARYEGVYFYGRTDKNSDAATVYSVNNVVRNNIIYNCCGFGKVFNWNTNHYGIGLGHQKDMIIEYNTIIQPEREGPVGVPIGFTNRGHHCGLKIRYNHIETAPKKGSNSNDYGWFFALELWSPRGGNEIYNNRIIGDIDIGGDNTNDDEGYGFAIKIYKNDCRLPENLPAPSPYTYRAVRLESGMKGGVYIYQNYFAGHYTGVSFDMARKGTGDIPVMLCKDVYVFLNTFVQTERDGADNNFGFVFSFLSEQKITDPPEGQPQDLRDAVVRDIYFWRNTIYNSAYGGGKGTYSLVKCNDYETIFRNINVVGNICYNVYEPIRLFDVISIDSLNVNYNIFYNAGTTLYYFKDMIVETFVNIGNTRDNPMFVNASEGNFELQSGSPAINAILAGVDIAYDFRGWPIVGLPDIGAYEYGATAPAAGGMLIDQSGVLLRSDGGTLMRVE